MSVRKTIKTYIERHGGTNVKVGTEITFFDGEVSAFNVDFTFGNEQYDYLFGVEFGNEVDYILFIDMEWNKLPWSINYEKLAVVT